MPSTLTLGLAQFRARKGDYAANLRRLGEIFAQVETVEPRPQVLVLPETALTGYFVEGGVRDLAVTAGTLAADLGSAYASNVTRAYVLDIVVGFYEVWENTLYNSAMYVTLGAGDPIIRHVHRKNFLPTYGLFDEERFVERGHDIRAFETGWGRAAVLVCEDAWHSLSGTIAALDGAQIVFVCAAAPARGLWPRKDAVPGPASVARWERLIRDMAEEHGVFVALTNLVGNEGGKGFPGADLLAGPHGEVRARGPLWEEALVTATIDLSDLTRARADMPLLSDLRTAMPHLRQQLDRATGHGDSANGHRVNGQVDFSPATENGAHALVEAEPAAVGHGRLTVIHASEAGGPPPLEIDAAMTAEWLTHFVRDEIQRRGFQKAIVAISGGVDSAVTAFLAARALGPQNVVGVRLPYRTSSPDSLSHAQLVTDALGIESMTIDISEGVDGYLKHQPKADASRRGNVMARMRMIALFDLSAACRALPLGTGNKTERLFGYFTWHADDSPPINPLGDLFKTQVWTLARHLGVPDPIVSKPPSADLVVGQTDEGDFGISYAKADEILNWMLSGYSEADLEARGFDPAEVEVVHRRLSRTHWKRKLPTVAMVSPTAIGESYLRPVDY
jgi:NAD+ synthase (glutamine-hydrolysing)